MTAELKPCAHCGKPAKKLAENLIVCSDTVNCNAEINFDARCGDGSVDKAWNTRAADQRIAALETENARLRADAERFQRALAGYKKGVSLSSDGSGYINQFLDAIKEAK